MTKTICIAYRELYPESSSELPCMGDLIADVPQPNEDRILHYLDAAPAFAGCGKLVKDVFDPEAKVMLGPGTQSDGLYVWPSVLAYYVRKYHVRIQADFVVRMMSLNWRPPSKSNINWENVENDLAG